MKKKYDKKHVYLYALVVAIAGVVCSRACFRKLLLTCLAGIVTCLVYLYIFEAANVFFQSMLCLFFCLLLFGATIFCLSDLLRRK